MTLQITTDNSIIIDGRNTGLKVTQSGDGTIVYTPESRLSGQQYKAHTMPHARYSTAHTNPASGAAGSEQFEADVRVLLEGL